MRGRERLLWRERPTFVCDLDEREGGHGAHKEVASANDFEPLAGWDGRVRRVDIPKRILCLAQISILPR